MGRLARILKDIEKNVSTLHKEQKLPYLSTFCDIIYCGLRYGASPNNYAKFDFYKIKHDKRSTFMTNKKSELLIRKYNQGPYRDIFENKITFAQTFADVFGRDWLDLSKCTKEEYEAFLVGKDGVLFKALDGSQGRGIDVFRGNYPAYDELGAYGNCIAEDFIVQHPALAAYYDKAVACIRVITVTKDGTVHPIVANITYGSEHEIANASFGGITAEIDIASGLVITHGGQYGHKTFETHPTSGLAFKGFQIPFWPELLAMLDTAGTKIPQVGYVGWDIAIGENGPIMIEGNTSPGYTYFQIPQLLPDQIGPLDRYAPYL